MDADVDRLSMAKRLLGSSLIRSSTSALTPCYKSFQNYYSKYYTSSTIVSGAKMHLQAPASVAPSSLRDDEAADNLTDEQIEQLLKNAADRMTRTMPADIAGEVTSATDKMLRCLKRYGRALCIVLVLSRLVADLFQKLILA